MTLPDIPTHHSPGSRVLVRVGDLYHPGTVARAIWHSEGYRLLIGSNPMPVKPEDVIADNLEIAA